MTEISVPRRETQRQIEGELPEVKIFDLLSSVGNAENKALELIVMRKGVIYSRRTLHQEVMTHQGQNRRWEMNSLTPFGHCRDSLSPIGLVTKEALSPDGTAFGYEITNYGLTTGFNFAGLLLKWSYDHPSFSLRQMFASTPSPVVKDENTLGKKRAQETRYKIFWEITTNPTDRIRIVDIANVTDEFQSIIGRHLYNLGKNGVISYESTQRGQPIAYYRLKGVVPNTEPEQYRDEKTLSTRVYKTLTQKPNEYLSSRQVADFLIKEYPEYRKRFGKKVPSEISRVLSHFANQGYCERKRFIGGQFQSEVHLSDEQRETIVSLVTAIDKFMIGGRQTIEEGKKFAQRVANDPQLFSELMLKAKEASPFANITSREDMQSYLLSILYEHPNSTVNQVQQFLKENYDKRLGREGIIMAFRGLVKEEKVVCEKTKFGNVYRVAEDAEN